MAILPPYSKTTWTGCTVDRYTAAALKWAQKACGIPILLGQGSYHPGVAASGGTHDGGGVVDVRVKHLTVAQRVHTVAALKEAGFAVWHRDAAPNVWPEHVHAVLIGNTKLSRDAADQVKAFDRGRDGLRGDRVDSTYRPSPKVKFNYLLGKPVKR